MALKPPFLARLRRRERMLLLVAAVCLAVYLLASFVFFPRLRRYRLNGGLIEAKERLLSGYRETLEKEKGMEKRLATLRAALKSYDGVLLTADKPPLAAAELQNKVKEAAGSRGLDIVSERITAPAKGDNFNTVPVEVTANGSIGALRDFLYTLETGTTPLMLVPEITIRINKRRTFDAATKKYLDLEELQSTMLISGLMRGEP